MVSNKSFTLLVDTRTIPIFTVFSIIFEQVCLRIYIFSTSNTLGSFGK